MFVKQLSSKQKIKPALLEHHKKVFDDLSKKLDIKEPDDWYKISAIQVKDLGAQRVMGFYSNSLPRALATIYPNHDWVPWKFPITPSGFWKDIENQRAFMDSLAKELNIKTFEDWYKVSNTELRSTTRVLLHHYNDSLSQALAAIYPEYQWLPWRFNTCPRGYWDELKNQRAFMDYIASVMNVQKPEDWYKVTCADLDAHGGITLKRRYGENLRKILQAVYPSYSWTQERFMKVPRNYWSDIRNVKRFMDNIATELGVETYSDWLKIPKEDVIARGGGGLISRYRSFRRVLAAAYPNSQFASRLTYPRYSILYLLNETSLCKYMIREENRTGLITSNEFLTTLLTEEPERRHSKMELDIVIPFLSLAFEYQGPQHYQTLRMFGSLRDQQIRDELKRQACVEAGFTLIPIPYWWNGMLDSLAATIHTFRPDLFTDYATTAPIVVDGVATGFADSYYPQQVEVL